MLLPFVISHELPLTDPVLKFLLILVIILSAPLLLNKLKIPHLLGLIIAGAIIGPNGLNLVLRDSSIILSGTAGLLYIIFLAGLEIDMGDFKKNSGRSFVFGMYTFLIPMALGIVAGLYVLHFSMETSILLASMFASHTLIAYPIISKLGITKDKSVTITVGGTMITDMLALLVLTVIVGMATGVIGEHFWTRLSISIVIFVLFVVIAFPIAGRWFFKHVQDSISQYIFVLVMVFLGAYLAELAGIESIIGSFLAGLSLNRLIPRSSPLMHRVEFIGNSIFIPFFLIGVGASELLDADSRTLQEVEAVFASVELVVEDLGDAALLNEERAVDAGAVRDEDRRSLRGVAVFGELGDGVQLRVLHFGARHRFAVHFHFAAVVVPGRHAVPAERDDRVVLYDDATHLETSGVTAFGGDVGDAHVHRVVFLDIHGNFLEFSRPSELPAARRHEEGRQNGFSMRNFIALGANDLQGGGRNMPLSSASA